jgi:hypothetical protein
VKIPERIVHLVGWGTETPKTVECVAYFHQPKIEMTIIMVVSVARAVTGRIENPAKPLPSNEGIKPLLTILVKRL